MQTRKQVQPLVRRTLQPFFILVIVCIVSFLGIFGNGLLMPVKQAHGAYQDSGVMNTVVYDLTHNRYTTYNASSQFIVASSMKVPIMLTFFDMIERRGRGPTNQELHLLTTMIENSNNDSASALYFGEIGGAAGVTRYMQKIGVTGLSPNPNAWGYSLMFPLTMVQLLTRLYKGSILNAHDRNLSLYLMQHVQADQRVGVGDTAPKGATVALKDGWVVGPDGYWVMNSSGIVTLGKETYIIASYTRDDSSLAIGQNIVRQICGQVAAQLQ